MKLSKDQTETLYRAKKIKERGEDPVVVSNRAVDQVRAVLGDALRARGVSNPDAMDLEALAGQFLGEEGERVREDAISALEHQHPETGSMADPNPGSSGGANSVDALENLPAHLATDAYQRRKMADALAERGIDQRASEIREELAADLGCEVDDLPTKRELQRVVQS